MTRRVMEDGTEVAVQSNEGIRKICRCPRAKWKACKHPWYFNYQWKGLPYRFNLNRHLGKPNDGLSKSEADRAAEEIRIAIRNGTFQAESVPAKTDGPALTFEQFAAHWQREKGYQRAQAKNNDYRLQTISDFVLPSGQRFGDLQVGQVTHIEIDHFRDHRKKAGLSPISINHDLKLLRCMFNWGVRVRIASENAKKEVPVYGLVSTPFMRVGNEALIKLEKETPREFRFSEDDERRLLSASDPYMHDFIVAMLDLCTRPGELLKLQVKHIDLQAKEVELAWRSTKTRTGRTLPLTSRLCAVLEMRLLGPDGKRRGAVEFVFGNEVGEQLTLAGIRPRWETLRGAVWGEGCDVHLADLRHEAGSAWEESGVATSLVSKFLGHKNLNTTTRYLNNSTRQLKEAVAKRESARVAISLQKSSDDERTPARPTEEPVAASASATVN